MEKVIVNIDQDTIKKSLDTLGLGDLGIDIKKGTDISMLKKPNPFVVKEKVKEVEEVIEKGEDVNALNKNEIRADLKKAEEIIKGFGAMQDSLSELKALIIKKGGEVDTLIGVNKTLQEENETLQKGITSFEEVTEKMTSRIKHLEEMSGKRKSITSNYVEKGNFNEMQKATKQLSLQNSRAEIINLLAVKANVDGIEKGEKGNPLYVDALLSYEASRQMPAKVIEELKKEGIVITK